MVFLASQSWHCRGADRTLFKPRRHGHRRTRIRCLSSADQTHRQLLASGIASQRPIERPQLGVKLDGERQIRGIERAAATEGHGSVDHAGAIHEHVVGDRQLFERRPSFCNVIARQAPVRNLASKRVGDLVAGKSGSMDLPPEASRESMQTATAGPCGSLAMSATSALASTTAVTLPRRSGDRVRPGLHERGPRHPRHHPPAPSAPPADRVLGEPAPSQGQRRAAALQVARQPPRLQRDDDAAPRPQGARTCASPDAPCDLCSPYSKCRRHLSRQRRTDTAGRSARTYLPSSPSSSRRCLRPSGSNSTWTKASTWARWFLWRPSRGISLNPDP